MQKHIDHIRPTSQKATLYRVRDSMTLTHRKIGVDLHVKVHLQPVAEVASPQPVGVAHAIGFPGDGQDRLAITDAGTGIRQLLQRGPGILQAA